MKLRRVKITGIGPVTPAGVGREAFERGIREAVSRIKPHAKLTEDFGPFVAATVDPLRVDQFVERFPSQKNAARHTLMAVVGAALALRDAGIDGREVERRGGVIVTGSSLMDFGGITRGTDSVFRLGVRGAQPRLVFSTNSASVPATIGESIGVAGRSMALQSSCCSGIDAVGYAFRQVATGETDLAVCGGTEAPLFRHPMLELRAAGLTPASCDGADRQCRPFDLWRTTGVVSEGACMFILEPEESPRPGYCVISGYAYANDPAGDLCGGLRPAIEQALADARVRPNAVEVINAWGPGHRLIDAAESRVLRTVFGRGLSGIATASIKGAVGSALGAAPAIQLAAAALGLFQGFVPPTVNWKYPDPACPLNLDSNERLLSHRVTLINSHGVAGMNSAIVITR